MTQVDTKLAILDAAEELFGAHGFAATSLRELTTRAQVNLAAVHYHFGSKEGLCEAVLARRIDPINQERLRRLDALEAGAGGSYRRLDVRAVMAAFIEPVLDASRNSPDSSGMCRMFGRIMAEQPAFLVAFLHQRFGGIAGRFVAALRRSVPHLTEAEAMWRLHFSIGALAHTMHHGVTLRDFSNGQCDPTDLAATGRRLVDFVAGGFLGPQSDLRVEES